MAVRARLDRAWRDGREVQRQFASLRGGNLAAAISLRAFLALFPIALLTIAFVGFAGGDAHTVARSLGNALGLGDDLSKELVRAVASAQHRRVESSIVGVLGLVWTGSRIVPELVLRSSALYGTIGAVFALLVWLLVLGRLIVYTALLERVRWTDAPAVSPAVS